MATRYLYPSDGEGGARYYVDEGTVYEMSGGAPVFYIQENVVYAYGGKPTYWISDNYLYEYATGQHRFYFSGDPDGCG